MIPRRPDPLTGASIPLDEDCGRNFLYARFDPDVTADGLQQLGLDDIDPHDVQRMDSIENIDKMRQVGRVYAERHLDMSLFEGFF